MENCVVICFPLPWMPDRRKWEKIVHICFAEEIVLKKKTSVTRKHLTIPGKVIQFLIIGQDINKAHL